MKLQNVDRCRLIRMVDQDGMRAVLNALSDIALDYHKENKDMPWTGKADPVTDFIDPEDAQAVADNLRKDMF